MKEDDSLIGTFVNASDVIAVDGFTRDHIVVNDGFPGPTIEVMEGAQVGLSYWLCPQLLTEDNRFKLKRIDLQIASDVHANPVLL